MFNRTYHLRAVKKAGGGHKAARRQGEEASLGLPWAGLFRPKEPWRATVLIAAAAEAIAGTTEKPVAEKPPGGFHRPELPIRAQIAANRCKKRSRKLQGVQLSLFPEPSDPNFYRPALGITKVAADPERPLADLFPMAYSPEAQP